MVSAKNLQKGQFYTQANKELANFDSEIGFSKRDLEKIRPYVKFLRGGAMFEVPRNTKLKYKNKVRGYDSIMMEVENTGVNLEMHISDQFNELDKSENFKINNLQKIKKLNEKIESLISLNQLSESSKTKKMFYRYN